MTGKQFKKEIMGGNGIPFFSSCQACFYPPNSWLLCTSPYERMIQINDWTLLPEGKVSVL